MHHTGKTNSAHDLMKDSAPHAKPRSTYPAWIDSQDFGVPHACAVPRIRDSLVLRLVAGRRQERAAPLIHATGTP
jgi:hypothetical protein